MISLFANRLGSIITAVSVSTGAVAADYDYSAYGERMQVGALEQPNGYTGREHDAESGLYHYRARTYDPVAGVFVQVDPIGFGSQQANLYAYGFLNPIRFGDPTGMTGSLSEAFGQVGYSRSIFAVAGKPIVETTLGLAGYIRTVLAMMSAGLTLSSNVDTQPRTEDQCEPRYRMIESVTRAVKQRYDEYFDDPWNLDENGRLQHRISFYQR